MFLAESIVFLQGIVPVVGEPVFSCPVTEETQVKSLVDKMFATPNQAFPNIHARDYRKGEPPLMAKYTKYKSYKAFGLHSVSIGGCHDFNGEWRITRTVGDGGMGWKKDPHEGSSISFPPGTSVEVVKQAFLRMIFQARDNWIAEHPPK